MEFKCLFHSSPRVVTVLNQTDSVYFLSYRLFKIHLILSFDVCMDLQSVFILQVFQRKLYVNFCSVSWDAFIVNECSIHCSKYQGFLCITFCNLARLISVSKCYKFMNGGPINALNNELQYSIRLSLTPII
jgi:hypothetical protein